MDLPGFNNYMNSPYPFIVPVPRSVSTLSEKENKQSSNGTNSVPNLPYGVPLFPPPPGQGPITNGNGPPVFPGAPYPLVRNFLNPRLYQDAQAHFLYFPSSDVKTSGKGMNKSPEQNREDRSEDQGDKKVNTKREPKEEKKEHKKPGRKKKKVSYCICERPEDGKFMVGCDVCDNWFHPKCVNISKKIAKNLDYFVCPHCKEFVPEEVQKQAILEQKAMRKKKLKHKETNDSPPKPQEETPLKTTNGVLDSLAHAAVVALASGGEINEQPSSDLLATLQQVEQQKKPDINTIEILWQDLNLNSKGMVNISKENIFSQKDSQELLQNLIDNTQWEQEKIKVYNSIFPEPRLSAWYGDVNCNFRRNGESRSILPWTKELLKVKSRVQEICNCQFNNLVLNYYRNGEDYMIFEDEKSVEASKENIVFLSLGSERNFIIKNRNTDEVHFIKLINGGLIRICGEETSKNYIYCVPKARNNDQPRVSLVFRNVPLQPKINSQVDITTETKESIPIKQPFTMPKSMSTVEEVLTQTLKPTENSLPTQPIDTTTNL